MRATGGGNEMHGSSPYEIPFRGNASKWPFLAPFPPEPFSPEAMRWAEQGKHLHGVGSLGGPGWGGEREEAGSSQRRLQRGQPCGEAG